MNIPNGLPILSRGSHDRASGKACIMNAISYLNGDKTINDMPNCVDPVLAAILVTTNDRICDAQHRLITGTQDGNDLCPVCSHKVWLLGARVIGTGELARETPEHIRSVRLEKLYTRLVKYATSQQHSLLPVTRERLQNSVDRFSLRSNYDVSTALISLAAEMQVCIGDPYHVAAFLVDEYLKIMAPEREQRVFTDKDYETVASQAKARVYTNA
jgi:hypothetical protein